MSLSFEVTTEVYILIDDLAFDQEVPITITCLAEEGSDWVSHKVTDVTWDLPQVDHDATPKRLGGITQRVPEPLATWIREDRKIAQQLAERARVVLQEARAYDRAVAASLRRGA